MKSVVFLDLLQGYLTTANSRISIREATPNIGEALSDILTCKFPFKN